ncbi:MAG: valine--tRNA ligase [Spirochaetia bacterium]|nr:valine--tRNA ligase [Spirochaetia bacterium]
MDKYEPKIIEDRWYRFWTDKGYFTAEAESTKPAFSIVMPPPNVTGALHMGHALNNTLQDILARYKRATGYNVLWLPGCDHAGIATQNVVERELKKENLKRTDLGREKFLERVWEWKDKYGKTIMMQLRKLGSSCDWTRERFTMDEGLSAAVKEVFVRLYDDGLIYRGNYIVNWCPRCLTAISDIEVTHKEINGHFYHINYPYADGSGFIQVATTRPETLLGDTAVAVNPDDERYKNIKEGTMLVLPETGRQIPLIKDPYVDKTFGTGAVKITPAHDQNDFEVGRRHGLEIINVMHENGKMNEKAGKYSGMDRFECRKKIVETLKEQGLLVRIDDHKHAVGHCYRCDTIVEPYVSAQWFVKIKPLADEAIKAVEDGRVRFTPDMWKKVYFEWMNNIKDWCISRQLWWGHRIPAWYCECGETIVAKQAPSKCPKCGGTKLRQDEDVLDTWFSSGLWPFSTLGWPEKTKELKTFYPTSVLVTSWDILFFWIARMIMMGLKFMGDVPFHDVCINSLVGDSEGKKMSKSKGNVVDPLDIMEKFSADSLRFTMAAIETQSRYIAFTEDRARGYHSFMNKVFNASKFTIGNIAGIKEVDLAENYQKLKLPEKWILDRVNALGKRAGESIEKLRFSEPALAIYDFFWHEFCDWYIEISKIELAKPGDEEYKNLVKNVLLKVLKDSAVIMHPFIPFLTEEIYQNLPFAGRKESVMLENWPEQNAKFVAKESDTKEMEEMMKLIYVIRNLRGELDFSPADKADVYIKMAADRAHVPAVYADVIKALARVDRILTAAGGSFILRRVISTGSVICEVGIDAAAVKDIAKVIAGKEKRAAEIERGIAAIDRKLNDANFIKHAMPKLIEEERARIDTLDAERRAVMSLIEDLKKV